MPTATKMRRLRPPLILATLVPMVATLLAVSTAPAQAATFAGTVMVQGSKAIVRIDLAESVTATQSGFAKICTGTLNTEWVWGHPSVRDRMTKAAGKMTIPNPTLGDGNDVSNVEKPTVPSANKANLSQTYVAPSSASCPGVTVDTHHRQLSGNFDYRDWFASLAGGLMGIATIAALEVAFEAGGPVALAFATSNTGLALVGCIGGMATWMTYNLIYKGNFGAWQGYLASCLAGAVFGDAVKNVLKAGLRNLTSLFTSNVGTQTPMSAAEVDEELELMGDWIAGHA